MFVNLNENSELYKENIKYLNNRKPPENYSKILSEGNFGKQQHSSKNDSS